MSFEQLLKKIIKFKRIKLFYRNKNTSEDTFDFNHIKMLDEIKFRGT